jgi:phospholipase C
MGEGPIIRGTRKRLYTIIAAGAAVALGAGLAISATGASASNAPKYAGYHTPALVPASYYRDTNNTATPIKHLVVIFDENESFDHYFGTYPNAANPAGEPAFTALPGTPAVDGLTDALLNHNPNSANPARISRANALTCDQDHNYADEQQAFHGGLMDQFVQHTAGGGCADRSIVMDYFDGNTVTALWNLAQRYTMSDNFYGSTFGPSTPGAINLISGNTNGVSPALAGENGTMIADPDPQRDDCGAGVASMSGQNIGDLLNARGVTWGWFQGGFRRTALNGLGRASCGTSHKNIGGATVTDYSPHHQPFMYYASTANPHHDPPSSVAAIGHDDGTVNHQYDLADFDAAVKADNLPQVSFLKAAQFEDGHPGSSDPLDEQRFLARTLNEIQQSPDWASTAVIITYDDSDGWYDHKQVVSQHSTGASDADTICNSAPAGDPTLMDRCGPGPRLPFVVVSPWVAPNTVHHTQIEQASITRFIEDNWSLGRIGGTSFDTRADPLSTIFDFDNAHARAGQTWLDPTTGTVLCSAPTGASSSPDATAQTNPDCGGGGTPPGTNPPAPPGGSPPATKPPVVTKPPALRISPKLSSYSAKRAGKKVTLAFKVAGLSTKNGKATVTAKLVLKKKTVATAAKATVKSGKAKLTLKAKKTIKKGKYTLSVTVRQGTASKTVTHALTLK